MLATEAVPYRKIPGQSRIFLEYLECAPSAHRFYQRPPSFPAIQKFVRQDLTQLSFPRREMAAILRHQNARLGTGEPTQRNISKLESPGCIAVVTGQQVGLFAGPLYTIYKALTAIRVADEIEAQGLPCVPVFWMESEDHDLAEVTHSTVLGTDGSLHRLDFLDLLFGDSRASARSVGSRPFPEAIRRAVAEYASFLPEGKYRENVRALLEETYVPGSSLADSFGRLMARLLGGFGLVFFNPSEMGAKRLVGSVFRTALTDSAAISQAVHDRTLDLEAAGFHSQVHMPEDSTVVFFQQDGERRSLLRRGSRFVLKNTTTSFAPEELLALCETVPELFSPNVLLRPLIQDHLFPTAVYVGGPAEIAYFAQIEVLYRWFSRPMPAIWPRSSFTLLEPEISSAMNQAALKFEDCIGSKEHLLERLLEAADRRPAGTRLKTLSVDIDRTFGEVRPAMVIADASLGRALDTAQRKILHHVARLQAKFTQMEARQYDGLPLLADAILNQCYPNGNLQERELGIHGFIARRGPKLPERIYELLDLSQFAHQVVSLEQPASREKPQHEDAL